MSRPGFPGLEPPHGALVKAQTLTPAWEPDPPGPLSAQSIPERFLLPPTYAAPRPELVIGICLGTAAAAPFILFALPLWGFFATFVAVLGGARVVGAMRLSAWRDGMARAFEALERGEFDAAETIFREVALAQRDPILRSASADFGYLALRRGDYATALAIYSRAWRAPGIGREARAAIALNLAFCYAAMGEIEAAEGWMSDGQRSPHTPSSAAVVWTRLKNYERVLALKLPTLEPWQQTFVRHERRLLALMQAFAMAQTGEPEDLVAAQAALAEPAFPEEFDYVSSHWPALADFIKRHFAHSSSEKR
jgi:hypothetical protein